jgi:hypothetical protein
MPHLILNPLLFFFLTLSNKMGFKKKKKKKKKNEILQLLLGNGNFKHVSMTVNQHTTVEELLEIKQQRNRGNYAFNVLHAKAM